MDKNISDSPLIIGFCGFARCGKDTACNYILEKSDLKDKKIYSFGDSLRDFAFELDAYLPEMRMYYRDVIDSYGYEEAKDRFPCFRKHLVRIGNGARSTIGENVWLNAVKERIDKDKPNLALIKDVRYLNEAEFIIKNNGIVVYINRENNEPANNTEKESIKEIINKLQRNQNFRIVKNDSDNINKFYWNLFEELFELNEA